MTSAELKYLIATDEIYDGINGVKLIDIAAKVGVSKVSVYRAVERLEKNSYVERNEKNKVVLTEYGKKQLSYYREIMNFLQNHLIKQCGTPEDVAYNDALGVACAFSDISREKIADILRSGTCLCAQQTAEIND